jgi:hypothetical protein
VRGAGSTIMAALLTMADLALGSDVLKAHGAMA